jgi:1-acyl-sn-glycerol-3-phosphate acyltransferase
MFETIGRYWRIVGTGLGFVVIGIGGVFVFPALNILIRNRERRAVVARRVIQFTFRCIVGLMRVLGVFRYEIRGMERLEREGLLILANHPTLIDIVFLMAFVKRGDCIVKSALWRNPFTHATIRAAAYVRNDDDGVRVVEDCVASVRGGSNLIIFPEGTRTPADGSSKLKRGAANIAVRASCNITPVLIQCTPPMLIKGEKWWRLPSSSTHFAIEVKEDIDVDPFIAAAGSEALAARHLTEYLRSYFTEENKLHAIA